MRLGGLYPLHTPGGDSGSEVRLLSDIPADMRFVMPKSVDGFSDIARQLDHYGLSAIATPMQVENWRSDDCVAFGQRARDLRIVIGEGVLDLKTYLQRLNELDPDLTSCCEHLPDEASYAHNFSRIHEAAQEVGLRFMTRRELIET